jgi:hypothetical protein
MKLFYTIIFLFVSIQFSFCQDGFQFRVNQNKIKIPFKLVNNLVIIPIEINGVRMNFLLDSGVVDTVLFSLEDKAEVALFNTEKITLKGLGTDHAAEGLKSSGNNLTFSGLTLKNQTIIVILDETFNFSSSLGVPVNGIIGYHFFNKNLVEINYQSKKVIVHNLKKFNSKKLKSFEEVDISIENNKPYLVSNILYDTKVLPSKLLIDSGNSDAIWVFEKNSNFNLIPKNNFDDFLGRGFSGDIQGKRAIVKSFEIKNFKFDNPLVAFPDSTSLNNVVFVQNRVGSIGAGILKRFNLFFYYEKNKIYLKKNIFFDEPFSFNKSGITVQNAGFQYVQEKITENLRSNIVKVEFGQTEVNLKYKFELKPVYEITNIRKGTPAAEIGLQKGDIILSINNILGYRYSLEEINSIFKSEEGRVIIIEIQRNKITLKKKFKLRSIL